MDAGGISAIIFAILFAVVGVAYGHKLYSEGAFSMPTGDAVSLDFLSLLILYMPNTLFVYGFIADIMNQKYQYSISGITALFGMFFNKYVGGTVVGGIASGTNFIYNKVRQAPAAAAAVTAAITNVPENANNTDGIRDSSSPFLTQMDVGGGKQRGGATNLCSLPGFEWLENKTAPQGIIMSMTVLWYLLIEMWDTGQAKNTIALGVTTAITFFIQWAVLHKNKCLDSYTFGTWSVLIALVMAITFAGSSYGIQKIINKTIGSGGNTVPPVPSPGQPGMFVCAAGTVPSPDGLSCVTPIGPGGTQQTSFGGIISVGEKSKQSAPVDDNDQFVCEAYKDGELVTSTVVE